MQSRCCGEFFCAGQHCRIGCTRLAARAAFPSHSTEHRMKKIVVIGATGTLGQAVSAELRARHEVIEVGATRGQYRADITDPASVERLFAEIGKVDGIVTATGKVHFGPLPEMSVEQFWV